MAFLKKKEKLILLSIAALLIAIRFLYLGTSPFISDEPKFQLLIDEHFAQKTFPLQSFRGSSLPIHYGPTAVWFYALLRFFTADPLAIAFYHTIFFCLAFVFFYFGTKKLYGEIPAAWSLALAASSPYLFYYSRHPWDNTLLIPLTAIIFWGISDLSKKSTVIIMAIA